MYYKTKLVNHNYTLYDLHTHNVWCYVWNETDATLQSTTFASMLYDYILNHCENKPGDQIILYSDGCTYQNRNIQLSNALLNLAMEKNIVIIHKYFVKGHSQMEADSVHSTIETRIKNKEINVPPDYCRLIKEARLRNPYNVKYLDYTFFKSFDSVQFFKSIRPMVTQAGGLQPTVFDVLVLKYCPSGNIFYKVDFKEDYQILTRPSTRSKAAMSLKHIPFVDLPRLYNSKLKITKTKYEHLQSLLPSIPKDYHSFYTNLPH